MAGGLGLGSPAAVRGSHDPAPARTEGLHRAVPKGGVRETRAMRSRVREPSLIAALILAHYNASYEKSNSNDGRRRGDLGKGNSARQGPFSNGCPSSSQ